MKLFRGKSHFVSICILLVVVILLGLSLGRIIPNGKIAGGVSAGGIRIGGLTVEAAGEKLREAFADSTFDTPIQLVLGDVEKSVIPSDFLATYDYTKTAENAILYCREGNFFKRLGQAMRTVFVKKDFPLEIAYDEAAYDDILEKLMDGVGEKVEEHSWEIEDETLIVTTGKPGLLPDAKAVSDAIFNVIGRKAYDDKIVFERETRNPEPLTADFLYNAVCSEAEDASYAIENGKVIMHPHVLGIAFDKQEAQAAIDANQGYGKTFRIALSVEEPEVTLEDIEAKLFSEVIGQYSTTFDAGNVSRSKNIALASNKINGTILAPDEVFSYNGVVGERSYSEGFETASVYVNGETVPGVGGGICQVSSTLFNAVVFANLDIVERVNHQLTVSYVPLGRDATVDYGNIDFRFRNSTGYPIKIVCTANGGKMYAAVYGYKEDKSESVSFETVTIGHTNPPERKVDDPTLPKGEEKVEKPGSSGYVVDTYKIIKRNGQEAEKVYLCRSNYNGNLRIIHVGTGEAVPSPSPSSEPNKEVSVSPSETPSHSTPTPSTAAPKPVDKPVKTEEPVETVKPTEAPKETDDTLSDTGL